MAAGGGGKGSAAAERAGAAGTSGAGSGGSRRSSASFWRPSKAKKREIDRRAEAFEIEPNVLIDNRASNRYTVIEANARDRPALLNALAYALFQSRVTIHSAHIATYGERAVDTFYVTDLIGDKIDSAARVKSLEKRMLEAAASRSEEAVAA